MTALRLVPPADRGPLIRILVDGETVEAHAGENLAVALLAADRTCFRRSPRANEPRSAFCMMGVCQECVLRVDGALRQSCMVSVRDGMKVGLRGAV